MIRMAYMSFLGKYNRLPLFLRGFHNSAVAAFGRKGGASAFDSKPRELSKKQKKRKNSLKQQMSLKRNPAQELLTKEYFKREVDSPKTAAYIEKTTKLLADALQETLLPEGALLLQNQQKYQKIDHVNPKAILDLFKQLNEASPVLESTTKEVVSVADINIDDANGALVEFARQGDTVGVDDLLHEMIKRDVIPCTDTLAKLISALCKRGHSKKGIELFNRMNSIESVVPDSEMWAALVLATVAVKGASEAIKVIERLQTTDLSLVNMSMFNCVLQYYVNNRQFTEADDFWMRMHCEGLPLDKFSFHASIRLCALTRRAEKAFMLVNEMKAMEIEPDVHIFTNLFRATAEAPHWVNGYHDIIEDAMCAFEGSELFPTTELYDALIYAYSRACDPGGAEYYFWEMRFKGLKQSQATYSNFLNALARAQSVGAKTHGYQGRFVKPPPRPLTPEQKVYSELGFQRLSQMLADGLSMEGESEKGNRKQRVGKISDMFEEHPEAAEALDEEIKHRVASMRRPEEVEAMRAAARIGGGNKNKEKSKSLLSKNLISPAFLKSGYDQTDDDLSDLDIDGDDDAIDAKTLAGGDEELEKLLLQLSQDPNEEKSDMQPNKVGEGINNGIEKLEENNVDYTEDLSPMLSERIDTDGELQFVDPFLEERISRQNRFFSEKEDSLSSLKKISKLIDPPMSEVEEKMDSASIDDHWSMVEFGRGAPLPDYRIPFRKRQDINISKADLLFKDMIKMGVKPNVVTMTTYMSVFAEALRPERALEIFDSFARYDVQASAQTYRVLIRMHIRLKEWTAVEKVKEEMVSNGIVPDNVTYGMLIDNQTHRGNIVEALKLLEEVDDKKIFVSDKFIKTLRARCNKLGIVHPSMPADPNQWVKDVKMHRKANQNASDRNIQEARSALFVG